MSIEYTIDIQLTELGFPDVLQMRGTSVAETPRRSASSDDSLSPGRSPASPAAAHEQRPRPPLQDQEAADGEEAEQTSDVETARCRPLNPAQSPPDGRAHEDGAPPRVEEDSDDSEVSEVEEEEEEEEEEGLNNESSHSGDYHCSVCDLRLPSEFKLQDHMNLHTGARPYCCAECGKRFCQIYNYRVHLRTHAQTKVERHLCRVCQKSFVSEKDLKDHLSKTHFENEFYECDLCKRVFTSLKECVYHVQLGKCMLDIKCEACGRRFSSPKSLARHQKRSCRNFKCSDCASIFTSKNALLKHSFSHLGLLPYTCLRCRCHFRLAKLYRLHKCEPERIHCVACLREFLSQEDFQQHKKDTGCWGNQEPKGDEIRCLECGQRFDTSEELKKHAGAHQRVLKCAECGKGFRSALLLMSHMGGHAGNSPCLCQSCGLGFPHQQNYDSHLKTCGQTPQPASAPKKRPASKSSSAETKKLNEKPDSSSPANKATMPPAPVSDSSSPGPVTEDVSAGSSPPDGLWKLTLDKPPPPGGKLVLFLPVCPTQTDALTLPSVVSPTLPGPAVQVQPQYLGLNAALGEPLNAPLDLVTRIKQDPECEAPLDLSKKCNSSRSAVSNVPLLPVKSEPEEFEISGEADRLGRQESKNRDSKAIVRPHPGGTETNTEAKRFKMDPMDLSPLNGSAPSSRLIIDIKKEPQSPGLDFDSRSFRSC